MIKQIHTSIIGRSHVQEGTRCQDATFAINQKQVCGIALADGAGSKVHSEDGARLVTQKSLRYIAKNFTKILNLGEVDAAHNIIEFLQSELTDKYGDINEYGSTLLFVVMRKSDGKTIVGHIGDGHILKRTSEGVSVLSSPENGQYQNSTFFVTDKSAKEHLRLGFYEKNALGYMLMSDGSSHSLVSVSTGNPSTAIQKFFEWLENNEPKATLKAVQKALREVISVKTHDDCSLAMMVL